MTNISTLQKIVDDAETRISGLQEDLIQSAAVLSGVVGPLAASHRLAELALEFYDLGVMTAGASEGGALTGAGIEGVAIENDRRQS